jgi:hypothetical protein
MAAVSSSLLRSAVVLALLLVSAQYLQQGPVFVSAQGGSLDNANPFQTLYYVLIEIIDFLKIRTIGPKCAKLPTIPDFDLDRFIAQTWYVQKKQVNEYQDYSELFCITEKYDYFPTGQLTSDTNKLQMVKYLTGQGGGGVTGDEFIVNWMCLTPWGEGGQFKNAPCAFPGFLKFLGGPYWIVDTDYLTYAIVVGGELTERGVCDLASKLCTVPIRGELLDPGSWFGQRQGLYYFTGAAMPTAPLMAEIEAKAQAMGICTATMLDVVHEGCDYERGGHTIKP